MQMLGLRPAEWFFIWVVLGIVFVVRAIGHDLRR